MRATAVTAAILVIIAPLVAAADWSTFHAAGIGLLLPPGARITRFPSGRVRIDLPFSPGTALEEKYLLIGPATFEGAPASGIEIGGVRVWFELGSEGAAGSFYDYVRCIVTRPDGRRVALTFVLHSIDPEVLDSPPPPFDRAKEALAFWGIIFSLRAR